MIKDREEFRAIMRSVMNKSEVKDKLRKANLGKTVSKATKDKMRLARLGKKYGPHSEETKRKMSLIKIGKPLSIETRKKISDSHKGDKCYMWKGGVSNQNRTIRHGIEFRLWREAVFARDNWTCQDCKARCGNGKEVILHPHHIKSFSHYPELRFAINNGITLCNKCHKVRHRMIK